LIAATVDRYGRLDVLVNNAGTTYFIPHADLDGLTDEVWDDILSVNLKGTFFCCRAAASELKKTHGAIVNIASIAAHRASGSSIAYAVSKAGVVQLTRALSLALSPEVRVNSISPGLVSSRWFSKRFGDEAAAAQEETFAKATPLGKIATPGDVARAVVALLENDLITGQDLVIDGGKNVLYQPL
jgi:NAD(P)-dependent dehydrogenase (short-subunit alcohol dehydrogenase family)